MKKLSYQEKLNTIKDYTILGINSKKYIAKNPNFTRREKWLISRYYNIADEAGYFNYTEKEGGFRVKFVKTKKRKNKAGKRFSGYFVQGAAPGDKVIKNKIIRKNFSKTFIPLDFSGVPPNPEDDNFYEAVYDEVSTAIDPYFEELKDGNYFTIVLQNGWEVGQKNTKSTPKKERREGQAFAADLEGQEKIDNLVDKIIELLGRALNDYKMKAALVKGLYFYEFKNQRKPKRKEKSLNKKRRKKR